MRGWLNRWELNGWRNAKGARVRHSDIWRRILRWIRLFRDSPNRRVEILHVKAHAGTDGNERADELAKSGAKLRFELMEKAAPTDWFQDSLYRYWGNRKHD